MRVIQHDSQKNLVKIIPFKNKLLFDKFSAFLVTTPVYCVAKNGSNSFGEEYSRYPFFLTFKLRFALNLRSQYIMQYCSDKMLFCFIIAFYLIIKD